VGHVPYKQELPPKILDFFEAMISLPYRVLSVIACNVLLLASSSYAQAPSTEIQTLGCLSITALKNPKDAVKTVYDFVQKSTTTTWLPSTASVTNTVTFTNNMIVITTTTLTLTTTPTTTFTKTKTTTTYATETSYGQTVTTPSYYLLTVTIPVVITSTEQTLATVEITSTLTETYYYDVNNPSKHKRGGSLAKRKSITSQSPTSGLATLLCDVNGIVHTSTYYSAGVVTVATAYTNVGYGTSIITTTTAYTYPTPVKTTTTLTTTVSATRTVAKPSATRTVGKAIASGIQVFQTQYTTTTLTSLIAEMQYTITTVSAAYTPQPPPPKGFATKDITELDYTLCKYVFCDDFCEFPAGGCGVVVSLRGSEQSQVIVAPYETSDLCAIAQYTKHTNDAGYSFNVDFSSNVLDFKGPHDNQLANQFINLNNPSGSFNNGDNPNPPFVNQETINICNNAYPKLAVLQGLTEDSYTNYYSGLDSGLFQN